jgi:hypothetical protein
MGARPLARLSSSVRTAQFDNTAIPAPFLSLVCAPNNSDNLVIFAAIRRASSLLSFCR